MYIFTKELFKYIAMAKKKENIEVQDTPEIAESIAMETAPEVTITETSTTVAPEPTRSRKWMQEKYADAAWEDDAQYDEALANHLEDADARLASYAESDARIARILDLNPEFALVLDAMDKGMPFRVALRRYVGDILADEPEKGDDDFEAYREAAEAYLAEKAKTDEAISTRNSNLEESDKRFVAFVESQGWDEAKEDVFVKFVMDNLEALNSGEVSEQYLAAMRDAFTHDEDVEEAKEAGAIEARNEKITTKRIKASGETDGMPKGGTSSPIVEENIVEDDSVLGGILREYERRRK